MVAENSIIKTLDDEDDPHDPQYWAVRINAGWQKLAEGAIQVGRDLIEAKEMLAHGEFQSMVESQLRFDPSVARKLMAIARHPVISKRAHVHVLPTSWGTLYELTKVPPGILLAKIADGTITSKLERKQVITLKANKPDTDDPAQNDRISPMARLKDEVAELKREKAHLQEQLAAAEAKDGSSFDFHGSTANEIIRCMVEPTNLSESKATTIARGILDHFKRQKQKPAG